MSVQQDVIDLIAAAKEELLKIEGLAMSELNRVADGLEHALSAARSMVVPESAAAEVEAPSPVVEAPAEAPAAESTTGS